MRQRILKGFLMSSLLLALLPNEGYCGAYDQLQAIGGAPSTPPPVSSPTCVGNCSGIKPSSLGHKPQGGNVAINNNAAMNTMVTGMVVEGLLGMLLADPNSGVSAEQVRAQAEFEQQQRMLQQQKEQSQRAASADHLRDAWDRQDETMIRTLNDVFAVPGQENNAVVLKNGGQVRLLGGGAPDAPLPVMALSTAELAATPSSLQEELMRDGAGQAKEIAWDVLKESIKKAIIPEQWRNAKESVELIEKVNDASADLIQALGPDKLVHAAGSGRWADTLAIVAKLDQVGNKFSTLGGGDEKLLEVGSKLLDGGEITAADGKALAGGQIKAWLTGKASDLLVTGGM